MTASTLVEPAYQSAPPYERTLGPEVADLAELAGFSPDPEQRLGLDLLFALSPDGRSAAFEFAVVCSRQNLKTGLYKIAALGWLFITDQRLVVWSAHEFPTSTEAFRDMSELIEGCSWLSRRVKNIYRGHGDESIELMSGQRLIFKARTKGGGRGLTGNKVVLDEAMFLQPQHMGALLPTLAAVPDPQVVYGASAGLTESAVLRGVRDRGRRAGDPRLAYLEWCDDLPGGCLSPRCNHGLDMIGCRLDDQARWMRSNPAAGRRITLEYIAAERRALPPAEFARERLGWWDKAPDEADQWLVIPKPIWQSRLVPPVRPEAPAFAVAASWPDAGSCAIGVAGRSDDRLVVQVVDHRPGTAWVPARLAELRDRHSPCAIVCRDRGPTAALHAELIKAGIELVTPWVKESAAAFSLFYGAAMTDQPPFGHFGQPELDTAVGAAHREAASDGWVWARKGATDISPLEACTLACWGHSTRAHLVGGEPSVYVF